jgi:flavin-dependent dehydrogenase
MCEQNKMLSKRLKSARRTGDWLAAPLPRFPVRNHSLMGIIPIGNAAAALEPIGGEGMGLALRSAELAAESLLASRTDSLGVLYRQLWRRRRTGCRLTAQIVSRPGLGAMMQPLIEQFPIATRAAMWMMGK